MPTSVESTIPEPRQLEEVAATAETATRHNGPHSDTETSEHWARANVAAVAILEGALCCYPRALVPWRESLDGCKVEAA